MTITPAGLTKAAAAAAAVAGGIFIAVQIGHPASDTFTTETSQWVARGSAKIVMAVLALAGITGMYLRQVRRSGLLGLVGYLVFAAGYLAMFAVEVVSVTVLPDAGRLRARFVNDVVAAAAVEPRAATSARCRRSSTSRASATCSAGCCSASPCSAPASSPAGPPSCSPSAPSARRRSPSSPSRSTGRWRSRWASP